MADEIPGKTAQELLQIAAAQAGVTKKMKAQKKTAMKPEEKKAIPLGNAQKWLNRIKRSKKMRKPFIEDAERFIRMYQGDYSERPKKKRNFDTMSVNIIYSHIEIIKPAVYSGFPFIIVRPKPKVGESPAKAELRARNMEYVINYWFKELAVDEELDDAFFDTFFAWGAVELGWETDVIEKTLVPEDPEGGELEDQKSELIVKKDRPFIMRRDFRNIYFDPDARRRKECNFIAIEEVMKYNNFLASPAFTEYAKQKVKPQLYPQDNEDQNYGAREDDKSDREWVQIFTIWDKENMKKYVVTDKCDRFLNTDDPKGEEWPYAIDYKSDPYPICIHDGKRDRKSPYTWSEFKAYEAQIVEMNRIRTAIQIHVKRTLPKYMYTAAFGSREKVAKLLNARSDEATQVDNLEAMKPLENAEVPADLWKFNQMSTDDLLNVSGLFEYQNQSIADTATEASLIEGRSQVRKSERSKKWEQYVVEIAAKLAQLCQQNMDESLAIQIAGEQGIEWLRVSKEDIQGEFYFDIEPGIMEYKNEALRKQQLLKFAEITANDNLVNRGEILKKLAREFDISPEEILIPEDQLPPPPPPEPNIKFKDIDPEAIDDPLVQMQLIKAAFQQNGISTAPQQPNLPAPVDGQGGLSISGKDAAGAGLNPNGNPALPPVQGNLIESGNGVV